MPTLISDIKYADFSYGFESGMSALLGAVVIEDEIAQRRVVEASKTIIETVIAADWSKPRKHLLELMMAGIENQKFTERAKRAACGTGDGM